MRGWISLHKRIRTHWLWEKPDYLRAWLDLLMMANYRDRKQPYKDGIVLIKRGEIPISYRKLSARWGWSVNKIKRFILLLKKDTVVDTHTDYGFTVVKIIKYDEFQIQTNTATNTVKDTATNTVKDTTIISNNNIINKPPIVPHSKSDLSESPIEPVGGDSFAIQFFKLWVGEGKIIHPPTAYERKDIVQYGLKYNSDIKFWAPFLQERQKRLTAGQFYHTSIKAFCGGAFREYTAEKRFTAGGKKPEFRKTTSGVYYIAYCSKCGMKELPKDMFQIREGSSCCHVGYTPDKPTVRPDTAKADKEALKRLGVNI